MDVKLVLPQSRTPLVEKSEYLLDLQLPGSAPAVPQSRSGKN